MFHQLLGTPAGVACIATTPNLVGIKPNGVPVALQTTYERDFAGNTAELAGSMALSRRPKRVRWIENKKHRGVHSSPPPTIPFDMLQLSRQR